MKFKVIVLLMFTVGILGMLGSLSAFAWTDPSYVNLFLISMFFMMATGMTVASGIELVKN